MRIVRQLVLFTLSAQVCCLALAAEDGNRASVVRITVTQRPPNFVQPWTKGAQRDASGTGFVIEGNRILTNAHVVQHASQIYVQGDQSSDKVTATALAVAPAIDLALLEVEDKSFFSGRPPLPFAEGLPKIRGTVNVYGFPIGGEQMSVTEGIISRVELAPYSYGTAGLRVQVDAALNPGNSGGPAISEGKLIGAVFSGIRTADNIGYLIPVEEVNLFLSDVADGAYDGKPRMTDQLQTCQNDALRQKLKLPKDLSGVVVTRPAKSDESYPLKEWDLITHIGEHPIDSAAKVNVSADLQLPFIYHIPKLAKNGKVPLTIFRDGQSINVQLPVSSADPSLIPYLGTAYPRYFIYGPLVFSPACKEFIALLGDRGQALLRDRESPLMQRLSDEPEFEGEELVVVPAPLFVHRITKGYGQPMLGVLTHVNGMKVKNLSHLVSLLKDLKDDLVEFKFAGKGNETLVFRRSEIAAATEEILTDNSIRKQCSDDLLPLLTSK